MGKRDISSITANLVKRPSLDLNPPIFVTDDVGKHTTRHTLGGSLQMTSQRLGRQAGVPNALPHRFWHTFAILSLRGGGAELAWQKILEHEICETLII